MTNSIFGSIVWLFDIFSVKCYHIELCFKTEKWSLSLRSSGVILAKKEVQKKRNAHALSNTKAKFYAFTLWRFKKEKDVSQASMTLKN